MDFEFTMDYLPYILLIVAAVFLLFILTISYVKAPPDIAYIISGLRKEPKVLIGKAGIRVPFLQRLDKIHLGLMQIDVQTRQAVPTKEYIDVYVDGVANIKVSKEATAIQKASQHFLNMPATNMSSIAKENLEGNLREIIGQMTLVELVNERDKFAEKVKANATDDMEKMGFEIVNLTIQNFKDDHEAIKNLGVDNLESIRKNAQIARAEAEKEVKIRSAKADQEGSLARAEADAEIARQQRDLAIKKAEFKREEDKANAEADAAHDIEKQLQQKAINENEVAAEIAKTEKLSELAEKEISVKERKLDAEIKKQADADKYREEREAESRLFIEVKEAEALKAKADAQRYAAEQEAAGIKAKLLAEADGIEAKGLAEAKAIDKKAEAMKKYGEAAIIEMYMNALPQVAKEVAAPLNNVDSITMYGSDNSTKIISEGTKNINQIMRLAKDTLGLDLGEVLKNVTGTTEPKERTKVR